MASRSRDGRHPRIFEGRFPEKRAKYNRRDEAAGERIRRCSAILVALLVLPSSINAQSLFSPAQASWNETYIVDVSRSVAASGGRLGIPELHITGRLTIRSCCGFSTNDIMFGIHNQNGGSQNFGVVVGTFSFSWDTGTDSEYSLVFTNQFNQSDPSYHSKTVDVSVTELGPPGSVNFATVFMTIAIGAVSAVSLTVALIFFLHRRKQVGGQGGQTRQHAL